MMELKEFTPAQERPKVKQRGVFKVTYEKLGEVIGILPEHKVIGIVHNDARDIHRGVISVIVAGPLMPHTPEGFEMMTVGPEMFLDPETGGAE